MVAIALITTAGIFLTINLKAEWGISPGSLGIISACIFWGIDNNLTRHISAKDPLAIVIIKGLGAGCFSLAMALLLGNKFPGWPIALGALVLGCFSYGISIVLFIHAMRGLGAGRTSALFSTAPIAGVLLSYLLFQESPTRLFILALPLMIVGALLLVNDPHEHHHIHEMILHEHSHTHDDQHHEHDHEGELGQRHSHVHKHDEVTHWHHHMPDLNHRHIHPTESQGLAWFVEDGGEKCAA